MKNIPQNNVYKYKLNASIKIVKLKQKEKI